MNNLNRILVAFSVKLFLFKLSSITPSIKRLGQTRQCDRF